MGVGVLRISESQLAALERWTADRVLEDHVAALTGLAPELLAPYSPAEIYALTGRMLVRAESLGLQLRGATIAFCYASLLFGVGFETLPEHAWTRTLVDTPPDSQADRIWDAIAAAAGDDADAPA